MKETAMNGYEWKKVYGRYMWVKICPPGIADGALIYHGEINSPQSGNESVTQRLNPGCHQKKPIPNF